MENNPLRQFFRRPAVHITLPSKGIGYDPEDIDFPESGELPVYPMTAIDEITLRTPDALFNGSAVAALISSCVPAIKNPYKLKSSDIDAVLISIRAASGTENLDIESKCPSCDERNTYNINLVGVLSTLSSGDYETPYEIGSLTVKLRPLTYKDVNDGAKAQFELERSIIMLDSIADPEEKERKGFEALQAVSMTMMELISKSIEYIQAENLTVNEPQFILDFLQHCDKQMYHNIRDKYIELKSNSELKPFEVECPNCHHQYKQAFTLNPSDFFA